MRGLVLAATAVVQVGSSAVAFADFLYVSSRATHEVLRFDSDTGDFVDAFVTAGSGGLDEPSGLTFGPDGNLYVASRASREVLRYDGATGAFIDTFVPPMTLVPGTALFVGVPYGIEFGPDGNLYATTSSSTGANLIRYDGQTGDFIDHLVSMPPSVPGFQDLEFGPDGNVYVTAWGFGVLRFDGSTFGFVDLFIASTPSGTAPPPDAADVPLGLEFGFDGRLYVHTIGGESVKRYDGTSGAFFDLFFFSSALMGGSVSPPAGITFGPDGDLFISKQLGLDADRILRIDKLTGDLAMVLDPTNVSGLSMPADIAFQPRLATAYGCGISGATGANPEGSLIPISGLPSLGSTIVLGVDNPLGTQAAGSLPLGFVSNAPFPTYPCGFPLTGLGMGPDPGELLIDLAPPNPIVPVLLGPPWAGPGAPAPISIAIPVSTQLIQKAFYFQGALFDPTLPSPPRIKLTGAVAIRIAL